MESTVESWYSLTLPIAARCGEAIVADPSRLLALVVAFLMACLSTVLLHWSSPGGPAWGRYWWSIRGRLPRDSTTAAAIPGPSGLPFIGSMSLMTGLAHRKLATAAEASGAKRLMAFSLGDTRAVVTSDPNVAREILGGSEFADRPAKESAYDLMFHRSIGFSPYGPYWSMLRRIAANHLFCPRQMAASASQRAMIAAQMVRVLSASAGGAAECGGGVVRPREILKRASLNNIMWSVFGKRYELDGDESEEMKELLIMVEEGYDLLGKTNWSDHLSLLAGLDLQGARSRCSRLVPRVNHFLNQIVQLHRAGPKLDVGDSTPAFIDVLLSLQGTDRLTESDMVAVLWEMIFRGTDSVAVLIEWVLARLVLHRDVQKKVHQELDRMVGRNRPVTEPDVGSLPYLQAVIKETLRMHPPGPLLSWARMSVSDVHVDGYLVPAGTTAMVNMWAITHDPAIWPEPLEFRPDRFFGSDDTVVLGSDMRLAPFGAGRRGCPGKTLAMSTVVFWAATLMHEFEWLPTESNKLEEEAAVDDGIDLTEVLRLSCEMAAPLAVRLHHRRRN